MSAEKTFFVVAVELTAEYVATNPDAPKWMRSKNAPHEKPSAQIERFLFRSEVEPIDNAIEYKPGFTLHRTDLDPLTAESLPELPFPLRQRIHDKNIVAMLHNDSRVESCAAPLDEYEQHLAQQDCQDEPPRASFDHAKPEIVATFSGMDYQRNESQPVANGEQERPLVQWIEAPQIFAPLPPRLWVCEKLQIGPGRSNFLVGAPSAGKTIGGQALGVCVATGRNVFDDIEFEINNPGPVAHIDYDQGQYDTFERYQAICNAYKIPFDEMRGKLCYVYRPPLHASDPESYEQWLKICKGKRLIIIDSLHGVMPGKDIMKPEFADGVYRLNAVSEETGATILILAHTRKPSRERGSVEPPEYAMLGTNQNFAAAGAAFHIAKDSDGNRIVTMFKPGLGNRGRIVETFALVFKQIPIEGSEVGGLLVTAETYKQAKEKSAKKNQSDATAENVKRVVEYILAHEGCSKTEVKECTGIKYGHAVAARGIAQRDGLISWSTKDGNRTTDKGKQLLGLTPSVPTAPPSSPDNAPEASDTSTDTPEPAKDA